MCEVGRKNPNYMELRESEITHFGRFRDDERTFEFMCAMHKKQIHKKQKPTPLIIEERALDFINAIIDNAILKKELAELVEVRKNRGK